MNREHIHNHYIWNSVSFIDGRKYHADKNEYKQVIQNLSDNICKEYNLSIIEPRIDGVSKAYIEWMEEKKGHPTWRSMIKR